MPAQDQIELAVSTVVFALRPAPNTQRPTLWLPLVRRTRQPFKGQWALPGGPLHESEELASSAGSTLVRTTGLTPEHLEQLYAFGGLHRAPAPSQPRGHRVVSIVYWALVRPDEDAAAEDGENVRWFPADDVVTGDADGTQPLAFDHATILDYALRRLRSKITYSPIAQAFLPETFTLAQLREVYEAILNRRLDPSNFRRQTLTQGWVQDTGTHLRGTAHRPPKLYRAVPQSTQYTLTIQEIS